MAAFVKIWPVLIIFIIVLGSIYTGICTPTEAGAIGAGSSLLFAIYRKQMSLQDFYDSCIEAASVTAMIFLVAFGALVFSNFINIAGMPDVILELLEDNVSSTFLIVCSICVIYILLGCIFDTMSMMLLTIPIFANILIPLDVNMVWFGILAIISAEIGLITPPIGMNVFVVKSMLSDIDIWTIFRSIWPFVIASIIGLLIILFFPQVALFLPQYMN